MPHILNHESAPALSDIADLLALEAGRDTDEDRRAKKQRAADLIKALVPRDPGFSEGDEVQMIGRAGYVNTAEGTTIFRLSDTARMVVYTRFVHKAPTFGEAISALLAGASIKELIVVLRLTTKAMWQKIKRRGHENGHV